MMIGKTARELEAIILEQLRSDPDATDIIGVVVTPDGDKGGFCVAPTTRDRMQLSPDSLHAKAAVAVATRLEYRLIVG
jgi:hypothetical protein